MVVEKSPTALLFAWAGRRLIVCCSPMQPGGSTYVQHRKLAVNNFWKDLYMKQKLKTIGTFLIYLAMFILICIFFTGHGTFIYEAF